MPELVLPDVLARRSFLEAMAEFVAEDRTGDGSMIGSDLRDWAPGWADPDVFAEFVHWLRSQAYEDTPRPSYHVPSTTWWWVEPEADRLAYLGRIALRHRLNDNLLQEGGHIGFDVRRSRRGEGHASAMLKEVLRRCPSYGIQRALITCNEDNTASRRTIEANGGALEDQRGRVLRFWVDVPGASADEPVAEAVPRPS